MPSLANEFTRLGGIGANGDSTAAASGLTGVSAALGGRNALAGEESQRDRGAEAAEFGGNANVRGCNPESEDILLGESAGSKTGLILPALGGDEASEPSVRVRGRIGTSLPHGFDEMELVRSDCERLGPRPEGVAIADC